MGMLRLAVGIMGNAASLFLYSVPILTFKRVIRKKSTEGFSCIPYIITLLNCLLYTWYGMPVVSNRWENFPLVTINGIGIFLELSFILIYLWFGSGRGKVKVAAMAVTIMMLFILIVTVSTFGFHDHQHRKLFVGCFGVVVSVAMYGSPLVAVKKVMETKSVEFMPFYLSFFSFVASALWMAFGLLSHDFFVASPNFVGCPLALLQLLLYCKYRKRGIMEEPNHWDIEKNEKSKLQLQQPVVNESTNDDKN